MGGIERIEEVFRRGRKALIGYTTCGFPSGEETLRIVRKFAEAGCDIIELGIPFSEPLADGPTIQRSGAIALERGMTPPLCLEIAGELSRKLEAPIVILTYYNPVLALGHREFCRRAAEAGVSGLIIPDLPPEEGGDLRKVALEYDLALIYLLAPTSTPERIKLIAERSTGFIYLVSLTGVTGARDRLPPELEEFVLRVRGYTEKPLCVGFGIGNAAQARRAARIADGVIIGSKLIQLIEEDPSLERLYLFLREIKKALAEIEGESPA